jgi:glycosyltransferase involved in cell wall biosynthesis
MPTNVAWIPGHPSNGSVSMDRYWRELHELFLDERYSDVSISCPLGDPPPGWPWPRRSRIERGWHKYVSYPLAVRLHPVMDVMHILEQGYAHLFRAVAPSSFKIATVHDLVAVHPEYSGLMPHQVQRSRRIFQHLRAADLLIADSECTSRHIVELLGSEAPKITVLPLGVDCERFQRAGTLNFLQLHGLGECPKVLSVGSLDLRKNNAILPELFEGIVARVPDVALLRVGPRLPEELADRLRSLLRPGHFVELGKLSDEELAGVYQAADVYFFPSLWEGFGLPVLEAMSAGTPVVCSDASSLPEVGGEAALYFDPNSAEQAAHQVVRVLTDRALSAAMRQDGLDRARQFTWTRHVNALREIYQQRRPVESNAPTLSATR